MTIDLKTFNADWLSAWTAKDVDKLLQFYAEDVVYRDPQTADGLNGHAALRQYLTGLFARRCNTIRMKSGRRRTAIAGGGIARFPRPMAANPICAGSILWC